MTVLALDESVHGREIEVEPRQQLEITVPGGCGGYTWSLHEPALEVIESRYLPEEEDTLRPDSRGHQRWLLRAPLGGTHLVELFYHRPWQKGVEPLRVIRFLVKVRSSPPA